MEITASLVKELREKTGVGLMNCKKALTESDGNFDNAIKYLREKGLASASKKAARSTNEGRIFIASEEKKAPKKAIILELNCETDFVAKNNDFIELGNTLIQQLLNKADATLEDINKETMSNAILKLGENISIKQFKTVNVEGSVSSYIHSNGKIGVIVTFSEPIDPELEKNIAMHIAATNPSYVHPNDVNKEEVESEKQIIRTQSQNEGKPEQIVEKIVEGRINKYFKEICLNEQPYIKDDKQSIKQLLPKNITITSFIRLSLV
jgi:elongation factor Ts